MSIAALIPVFIEEERKQGYRDAAEGRDRSTPVLGWGGYDRGYDQGLEDNEPNDGYDHGKYNS